MRINKQVFIFALSVIFLISSLISFAGTTKANDIFDIWYGPEIPWEEVEGRLDNFIVALRNNPEKVGYIVYTVGKNDSYKKAKARINRTVKHIVEYRKFDKRRLVVVYSGKYKETITMLQIEDKKASTSRFYFPKSEK
jgi:hypothetical protein